MWTIGAADRLQRLTTYQRKMTGEEREGIHSLRGAAPLVWKPNLKLLPTMNKRQSDQSDGEFRRTDNRISKRDGKWYFSSREGEHGPFDSESEAVADMEAYVMLIDLRPENERPVTPDC